jgi:putative transposase
MNEAKERERTLMPGPRPQPIILTDRQREMLEQLTRRTNSTQGLVRRARIVLAAAEGLNNEQISRNLGLNRETVRLWRGAWLSAASRLAEVEEATDEGEEKEFRLCIEEALADAPRSGTPATFTAEQICRIVALACEDPEECGRPVTHWSPPELADEAIKRGIVESISPRSVGRFLKGGGPKAASEPLLVKQRAGEAAGGLRRGG